VLESPGTNTATKTRATNNQPTATVTGVGKLSNDGKLRWPARNRNSICGDAAGENKWDVPGKIAKVYKAGQVINIDVVFAQNHLGRVNVRVCPLDAKDESKCKLLER
jgi:hypothetical protein